MKIAEVSVKRPVFAIMMTAALIVLGAVSYKALGLDLMPKTDEPVVNVQANLPGASAEEIETQITKRIEEAVNTISGIDELRASSDQGNARASPSPSRSSATSSRRPRTCATSWRRSSTSSRATPGRCRSPRSIPTRSRSSASPCIGPRAPKELTEIAEKRVKQELETVKDVGSVGYNGERKREIQLLLERRPAQRLRPDRRAGAHRGTAAERRDSRRTVHRRAVRGRAAHDGPHPQRRGFQPHRPRLPGRRLGHHVRRHRPRAGQRAGSAQRDAADRHARDRRPGAQAVGHQHRRGGRPRAGAAATSIQAPAAAGHPDQHRQRPVALHPPIVRGHQACT